MNEPKPWYQSKTIIVNALIGVLMTAEATSGALEPVLGAKAFGILTFILPVVNVFLRIITTGPVTARKG
jgi:hypothetical protein